MAPKFKDTKTKNHPDVLQEENFNLLTPTTETERNGLGKKEEDKRKDPPQHPPVPYFSLFRFASVPDWFLIALAAFASCGTGICLPILLTLFGDVANAFVNMGMDQETIKSISCNLSITVHTNATRSLLELTDTTAFMGEFAKFGKYASITGAVRFISGFLFVSLLNRTAENQVYRLRNAFFRSLLRQDVAWYDSKTSNDFASRITEDLNKIQDGIGENIGMFIFSMTIFIASMANAFFHGWKLTLVMLGCLPVLVIAMAVLSKVQSSLTEKELQAYAKAGGVAEEVFSSIRTVMAFCGQQKEQDRFDINLDVARQAGVKRGVAIGIGAGLAIGIIYATYALAFWYGTRLILAPCGEEAGYNPGDLVIIFFNVLLGALQMGLVVPNLEAFSVARGAAASIFDIIDRVPAIDSSSEAGKKPENVQGNIAFENVRFNYPSRPDVKILRGLSFDVPAGQTVALVGTSGCGKSTCIQLLQRFYDPLEGAIRIDGNSIKDLQVGWLRSQMGIVGQEPILFGTTIAENIRYGRSGVSQEEIEKAAKEANAHDFILGLPLKYETQVGERGAQLSGGQKQRIAIARALVRNPKILLLDEATSALDVQSEAVVQRALDKARLGRTTIIVAHRLSTIRNADRIIVIKDGTIEEGGTHAELMEKRGTYYHLVSADQVDENAFSLNADLEFIDFPCSEEEENVKQNGFDSLTMNKPLAGKSGKRSSENTHFSTDSEKSRIDDDPSLQSQHILSDILKMNKKEWPHILLGIIGSIIVGLSTPVYAALFAAVMGVLSFAESEEELSRKREEGNFYSLMFFILGLVVGIAAFAQSFSFTVAGESLTSKLRSLSFQAILKQEIGWFDQQVNNVGSLCARLSSDAANVQGAAGCRLGVIFQTLTTLIVCVVFSLYLEWRLGLIATCFTPLLVASVYFQVKIIRKQAALERKQLEKSTNIAIEAIGNIRTVASLGKENDFHDSFMESLQTPHRNALTNAWIRGLIFAIANSLFMFSYATTMYYGGFFVTYEGVHYTTVIVVSQALIIGTESVGKTMALAPSYSKAKEAANRIFALLRRIPQIDASSTDGVKLQNFAGNVNFHQVDFRYPTRESAQVLQGLKLAVKAGQTVALVGHSGCGKSTCIQLLERFYDPDAGHIKIDSQDTKSANISSVRSQLGIVPQEPILFNRTIGENIAYGDNSRTVQMEEIIEAARKANIHTFIQSLPNGYDTMVGEKGTQLSGGQKQRIAIARALVRNPKILLLDEATSALDSESEQVVQMALDAAREGRTCITIAHRLSTIQNADIIIVIHHGKSAEQGTHDELLKRRGLYFELCSAQNKDHL